MHAKRPAEHGSGVVSPLSAAERRPHRDSTDRAVPTVPVSSHGRPISANNHFPNHLASVRSWPAKPVDAPQLGNSCRDGEDIESVVANDHFVFRDGQEFAGTHLILDLWGARRLDDIEFIERAMRRAVTAAGATLLHIHLHHFGAGGGVSGVAVLAESHLSVHTWPERDFAAFDVFMCGDAKPEKAIEALEQAFRPERSELLEARRGLCE